MVLTVLALLGFIENAQSQYLKLEQPSEIIVDEQALKAPFTPIYTETKKPTPSIKQQIKAFLPPTQPYIVEIALAIAEIESSFIPTAKNPDSTASGLFQITEDTWRETKCEGNIFDLKDNTQCAVKLFQEGEYWRWRESSDKWLQKVSTSTRQYVLKILKERELATCSCVSYMRTLGWEFPKIPDPSYLEPNAFAIAGNLILLRFSLPHMGEITKVDNNFIYYKERILSDNECLTRENKISIADNRIRGYYSNSLSF